MSDITVGINHGLFAGTMVFERPERSSTLEEPGTEGVQPVKRKSVRRSLPGLIIDEEGLTNDDYGG